MERWIGRQLKDEGAGTPSHRLGGAASNGQFLRVACCRLLALSAALTPTGQAADLASFHSLVYLVRRFRCALYSDCTIPSPLIFWAVCPQLLLDVCVEDRRRPGTDIVLVRIIFLSSDATNEDLIRDILKFEIPTSIPSSPSWPRRNLKDGLGLRIGTTTNLLDPDCR